jgi:bacillithiol system protein YtxJ
MTFLKSLFGTSENNSNTKLDWKPLQELNQLDTIIEESYSKTVLIFKHSTTCSISRMAFKNFENEFDTSSDIEIYYLDLLNFRAISNEIASRFNVVHQSPQVLLIKNGVSVYNASHENIDAKIIASSC